LPLKQNTIHFSCFVSITSPVQFISPDEPG
jgi:hypothetical protein